MRASYAALIAKPEFRRLWSLTRVLATWDDHDYGENDAGGDFPAKEMSLRAFRDLFRGGRDVGREGVYEATILGPPGRRVQFILLDTRYDRSPLTRSTSRRPGKGPYVADPDPSLRMLSETQWEWLEEQLGRKADVRVIASSIQVLADEHGFETWGNLPSERDRLYEMIERTGAEGVIFISGDRHHGEISRIERDGAYPLLDVTSSSFNRPRKPGEEPNARRVAGPFFAENYGWIEIDWEASQMRIELRGLQGLWHQLELPLATLRNPPQE